MFYYAGVHALEDASASPAVIAGGEASVDGVVDYDLPFENPDTAGAQLHALNEGDAVLTKQNTTAQAKWSDTWLKLTVGEKQSGNAAVVIRVDFEVPEELVHLVAGTASRL